MKTLDLKVGYSCNNNCKHCVIGSKRYAFKDRSTNEIKEIMEWGRGVGCDRLVLTGGELTIRRDCTELLGHARALGYSLNFQTNGRALSYKSFAGEVLDAAGKDITVVIALLSSDPDCHNYLTSANSFLQTLQGISNMVEAGAREVSINTVVTKSNYRTFPRHAVLLSKLGVHATQYAFVHVLGNALENIHSILPRKKIVAPYIMRALDVLVRHGVMARCEAMTYCLMRGYENHISEAFISDTVIADLGISILDFAAVRQMEEKAKGKLCPTCVCFKKCEGPWRQYPEMFGWDEFVPVS
jgi:MoaA/NifB/PqqE/SkfB family radical SAM enzyme